MNIALDISEEVYLTIKDALQDRLDKQQLSRNEGGEFQLELIEELEDALSQLEDQEEEV